MSTEVDDFLEHFGVKGMKWGVRKRQSSAPSGSEKISKRKAKKIEAEAKKKYSSDAEEAKAIKAKVKKEGAQSLSNKEMEVLIRRMNLEQQYARLDPKKENAGAKFAKDIGKEVGRGLVKDVAKTAVKNTVLKPAYEQMGWTPAKEKKKKDD